MKTFFIFLIALSVGIAIGYQWNESRYSDVKSKLTALTDVDIEEYLRLKSMEDKYRKADEIFGKALLIFLADLGLRISEDKVAFAKQVLHRSSENSSPSKTVEEVNTSKRDNRSDKVQEHDQGGNARTESLPSAQGNTTTSGNAGGGTQETGVSHITGRVKFTGAPPIPIQIKMNADPKCLKENGDAPVYVEDIVVNTSGALANVFVYVKEGINEGVVLPVPNEPVVLDQRGCRYTPHITGIRVGQTLRILNSDATMHNVHSLSKLNTGFNNAMPIKGQVVEKKFSRPETMIRVKCDVHTWMNTFVNVMNHPYFAITDATGAFNIKGLPPGNYLIEAWHEKLGTKTQRITVGAPEQRHNLDFAF